MKFRSWLRYLTCSILASLVLIIPKAHAGYLNPAEAVNKVAWQGVLSQRIAKTYLLSAAQVDQTRSRQQLEAAISEFELILLQLENSAPTAEIVGTLSELQAQWESYSDLARQVPNKANAEELIEASNGLLFTTHKLVQQWRWLDDSTTIASIELANKQGMLSERIGMYYAAHYYGIRESWVIDELNKALKGFSDGFQALNSLQDRLPETSEPLENIKQQWEYAKLSLQQYNKGHYVPVMVSVTTDSMLEQMSLVASRYTVAAASSKIPTGIEIPSTQTELAAVITD